MKLIRLSLTIFACLCSITAFSESIDLSGLWRFQLDPMGFGKTPGSELYLSKLTESIVLPGSMDESGKGIPNAVSHVDRLSRKFEYCGQAWYQREVEIPESWQGKEIILTRNWQEAKVLLEKGESVCFVPDSILGRKTQFASHFWNPIMFNWDPMIVGTSIHHQHPVFRDFPTSYYADWQWWDILNYAGAIDLTTLTGLTPIIQSVDTYEVNRKLGIAFEAQVGKGKLFFLNLDLSKKMDERPATNQLLRSISQYVRSADFQPGTTIPLYQLDALFVPDAKEKQTQENAAIQQLLNQ